MSNHDWYELAEGGSLLHLAQAFARYFMRVGLPHDAKAFEEEGAVV